MIVSGAALAWVPSPWGAVVFWVIVAFFGVVVPGPFEMWCREGETT